MAYLKIFIHLRQKVVKFYFYYMAQWYRIRLPMQETQNVRFLGQEDPLEEEMETNSSILA